MLTTQTLSILRTKTSQGTDLRSAIARCEVRKVKSSHALPSKTTDSFSQFDCTETDPVIIGGVLFLSNESGAGTPVSSANYDCNCDCVSYIYSNKFIGIKTDWPTNSICLDCNCDCTEITAI